MANRALNAIITIGGTVSGSFGSAIGSARRKLGQLGSSVKELTREQKKLGDAMNDALRKGSPVGALHRQYSDLTKQIERARFEQERLNRGTRGMADGRAKMGAGAVAMGTAVAVGSAAILPIVQAASFEKAMLGVAKQVEGSRDENGKLTQVYYDMAKQVQLLGREVPIATNEIAEMVAAGARMGVAREELIGFTRTAAMMASAFDLPAGQLADDMGKIAGLYKIPIPAIGGLADAINFLDDNAISKGSEIIEFLTRTGGTASSVKVTGKEMAALGSTLLTMGERSETASTATNAMFAKFAAADKGTKKFKAAMREIGLSTEAVQKGMQTDAQGTLLTVLEKINKLPEAKRVGVMVELVGMEHADTLGKLSGNVEEYRRQIDLVNSQKSEGSMSREFAATLASTSAQWEIAKNKVTEFGVNIGAALLPAANQGLDVIGKMASKLADYSREHPVLTKNIAVLGGALIGSLAAWGLVTFGVGAATFAFNALKVAILTNPIGLAIVAIAVGAALIYANWEPIKAFFSDLWDGITTAAGEAWAWFRDTLLPFTPLGPIVQNWGPISEFFGALFDSAKAVAGAAWEWIKSTVLDYTPLGLVIKNWEPIKNFFSDIFNSIKKTAGEAIDWVLGKLSIMGDAWQAGKRALGLGGEGEFKASTMWKIERPAAPALPRARGAGQSLQDNSTTTIHVNGAQNPKTVVDEIERRQKQNQRWTRNGGGAQLFDPPKGQ